MEKINDYWQVFIPDVFYLGVGKGEVGFWLLVLCHLSPPMSRWRSVPTGSHEGTRATERGECSHEGSCLPDSAPRSWYSGAPPCGPGTPGVCRPRGQPLTWPPGTWLERSLDIPLVDWVQSSTSQDFMLSNKPVNIP